MRGTCLIAKSYKNEREIKKKLEKGKYVLSKELKRKKKKKEKNKRITTPIVSL